MPFEGSTFNRLGLPPYSGALAAELQNLAAGLTQLKTNSNALDVDALIRAIPGDPGVGQVIKYVDAVEKLQWRDDERGMAGGGEENVQADWNTTDTTSDAFIRNKPDSVPVEPDPVTGLLRAPTEADFGKLARDHHNLRIGTRVVTVLGVQLDVQYTTFNASGFRHVVASVNSILNPQSGETAFESGNRKWHRYVGASLFTPAGWEIYAGPPGWRGAWNTEALADAHVNAVGQRVWWVGQTTIRQVSSYTAPQAEQTAVKWLAEQERQELLDRPVLPAPALVDAGKVPSVNGTGDGYSLISVFSGDYNDLYNEPVIPAAQIPSDWAAVAGVSRILNKPTIPAAQVNADWSASSGVAQILNKPALFSGDYDDLTNKPASATAFSLGDVATQITAVANNDRVLLWDLDQMAHAYATITQLKSVFGESVQQGGTNVVNGVEIFNFVSGADVVAQGATAHITIPGEANVQADYAEQDTAAAAFIRNKPALFTAADADVRVALGVWDWAEQGDNSLIPLVKIPQIPGTHVGLVTASFGGLFDNSTVSAQTAFNLIDDTIVKANANDQPQRSPVAADIGRTLAPTQHGVYTAREQVHHATAPQVTWGDPLAGRVDEYEVSLIPGVNLWHVYNGVPSRHEADNWTAEGIVVLDVVGRTFYETYKTNPAFSTLYWRRRSVPSPGSRGGIRRRPKPPITSPPSIRPHGRVELSNTPITYVAGTSRSVTYTWAVSGVEEAHARMLTFSTSSRIGPRKATSTRSRFSRFPTFTQARL